MSASEEGADLDDRSPAAVPSTGDPTIDEVLRGLADVQSLPLAQHHDRLARAHEALHLALERSGDEPDPG
jgi:hypothetical protein